MKATRESEKTELNAAHESEKTELNAAHASSLAAREEELKVGYG